MITSPKLSALVAGLVVAIAGMGNAHAVALTSGNYKISFDNYDSGTTGYGNTAGIKCITVAACDLVPGIVKAPGSVGSVNMSADTMGIFSVSSIQNVATGVDEFIRGTSSTIGGVMFGPFLTGIFSNLMDTRVEVGTLFGSTFTDIRSVGGTFSLWSNAANYNPVHGPVVGPTALPPGFVDLNAMLYTGINPGGALFLSGNFAAGGAVGGDLTSTYSSNYNNNTISGAGFGALDFTGGAALSFFNTNSFTNVNGGLNDAYLTASFNPSAAAPNWTVISTGQFIGALQIPEPGSLLLASLALLGMGAVTRRAMKR